MIKINIVAVGKVKENYFSDGIKEYAKRLSKFCEFTVKEISEENFNKVDDALISVIKEREADRILPNLKGYVLAMAIEGKKYSSEKPFDYRLNIITQTKKNINDFYVRIAVFLKIKA